MSRVIYVELDGTLVEQGTMKPVEAVVRMIKGALSQGREVKILYPFSMEFGGWDRKQFEEVNNLCARLFGDPLDLVVAVNGADMTEFWSHRVVQLEKNTGRRLVPLKSFGG